MFTTLSPVIRSAQLRIDTSCPSPGTVKIAVIGEIDLSTTDMLRARLLNALSALHPRRIEVDLAGVTFMDCGGLTVLLVAGNVAARTACQLRITNPQPIVRRVLDLTGLLGVLTAAFDQAPLAATAADGTRRLASWSPPDPSRGTSPIFPPLRRDHVTVSPPTR